MRWMLIGGAVLGALAVAGGAFGAHALRGVLSARASGWYDTAASYHATHALALLACGLLGTRVSAARGAAGSPESERDPELPTDGARGCRRALGIAGAAFALGIALFSGSLYVMALSGWTRLGLVTPFGGLALIGGWIALAVAAARLPRALC